MKHLILFVLIAVIEAASASSLTVQTSTSSTTLASSDSVIEWTDPRTPNCEIFEARKKYYRKQNEEIATLLDVLLKKKKWRNADFNEYAALKERKLNLNREWARQKAVRSDLYDLSGLDEATRAALDQRLYSLNVQFAGLSWLGVDASEPDGFAIQFDGPALRTQAEIPLADFCAQGSEVEVQLVVLD